jgi:hypothetical protein
MAAATTPAYSLWLVPEEPEREPLARIIAGEATARGTPAWVPHITLLGMLRGGRAADDASILAATAEAAAAAGGGALDLPLEGTAVGDSHWINV